MIRLLVYIQFFAPLSFFCTGGGLHVPHLHPVLDGLQADRHLGQHADGLLLRFGLLSDEGTQVAIQHDGGSNPDDRKHGPGLLHDIAAHIGQPRLIWSLFAHSQSGVRVSSTMPAAHPCGRATGPAQHVHRRSGEI